MAAQLLAAHYAAMECYRRAMLGEKTSKGAARASTKPTNSHARSPSYSRRSIATAARASRRSRSSTSQSP